MCTVSVCGYTEESVCVALGHTGRTQTTRGHVGSDEDGSFATTELCNKEKMIGSLNIILKEKNRAEKGTILI